MSIFNKFLVNAYYIHKNIIYSNKWDDYVDPKPEEKLYKW